MRLDKFLVDFNIGSRSEVKEYIKKGMVCVNDIIEKKADCKIKEELDIISFRGKVLSYEPYSYYLLHKPKGVVSATNDNIFETVIDLLKEEQKKDLFPVGRLDKDTEGLLLITNDGMLAHRLLSPKKHVSKMYFATIAGKVEEAQIKAFLEGIDIKDEKITLPAQLRVITKTSTGELEVSNFGLQPELIDKQRILNLVQQHVELKEEESYVLVTITEGRFHQIKRMFEAFSQEVIYLKRISMGNLWLDEDLKAGEYRKLSASEIEGI